MGKEITGLGTAYQGLFTAVLIVLAVLVILCLIRAIIGPRIADRIVSVNMMGTMVIVIIAILTVMLKESYLADICIIYAMISFLAVIVLTKVYMGVYLEKKEVESRMAALQKTVAEAKQKEVKRQQAVQQETGQQTEEQQADKTDNKEINDRSGGIS